MGKSEKYLFIRKVINYLSHLDILIGIAGFVGGGVLLAYHSDFKTIDDSYNIYSVAYSLLITIGVAFFIAGGFGLFAHKKKSDCLMQTKNVMVYIFLIVTISFLIIQSVAIGVSQNLKNDTFCTKESFLIDYKTVYDSGKDLLCNRERDCPCDASKKIFNQDELSHFYVNNKYGATKVSSCPEYVKKIDVPLKSSYSSKNKYIEDIVAMLRAFESSFNCSGFCSVNNYYVFKDMNAGRPSNKDCKEEFVNFLDNNLKTAIILTSFLLAYLFISSIFTTALIFKKDKIYGFFPENQQNLNQSLNPLQNNNQTFNGQQMQHQSQAMQHQIVQIYSLQNQNEMNQIIPQNINQINTPPYSTYDPIQKEFQTPVYIQGKPEKQQHIIQEQSENQKENQQNNANMFDTPKL